MRDFKAANMIGSKTHLKRTGICYLLHTAVHSGTEINCHIIATWVCHSWATPFKLKCQHTNFRCTYRNNTDTQKVTATNYIKPHLMLKRISKYNGRIWPNELLSRLPGADELKHQKVKIHQFSLNPHLLETLGCGTAH